MYPLNTKKFPRLYSRTCQCNPEYIYIYKFTKISRISCKPFLWSPYLHRCSYLCLQFIFVVAWRFVDLSPNRSSHTKIKGIVIWRVRRPDVRGIVVVESFSLTIVGSLPCVEMRTPAAICRVI